MSPGSSDVDPRAHDVVEARARLHERAPDDLEADPRLLVRVVGRVGVARHDRRRPRHPDAAGRPYGARVADAFLERGAGGDELAIHAWIVSGLWRPYGKWTTGRAITPRSQWCTRTATSTTHGDVDSPLRWASVTKLATAVATLVAVEEGIVDLEDPAGPPGSTLRHLLSHASGLPFDSTEPIARPGTRRIYSNTGIEAAAEHVGAAAGMPFAEYFESVWGFPLAGSPAHGVVLPADRAGRASHGSSWRPSGSPSRRSPRR